MREVPVSDYQQVHKGDLVAQLDDDDYKAQVAQADAAVEAGKAAIENNKRQRDLEDAKIERALAGIDQANAEIAAAEAGKRQSMRMSCAPSQNVSDRKRCCKQVPPRSKK